MTKEDEDETRRRRRRYSLDDSAEAGDSHVNSDLGIQISDAPVSESHNVGKAFDTDSDSSNGKTIKVIKEQQILDYTFKMSWQFSEAGEPLTLQT